MTKRELAAFVCSHVFERSRDILLVAREQGDWMFLCGDDHPADEQYHVVGLNHLLERDEDLSEVLDLADNSEAERTARGTPWARRALSA